MDNFDLKKYLAEGRLLKENQYTYMNDGYMDMDYDEIRKYISAKKGAEFANDFIDGYNDEFYENVVTFLDENPKPTDEEVLNFIDIEIEKEREEYIPAPNAPGGIGLKEEKTKAQELGITEFPYIEKDEDGNKTYYEDSDGYWIKREYDSNNNEIYFENSDGYWIKREYDSNNNKIYYEDSNDRWSKREYDSNNNEIYFENNKGDWRKREYDSNNNEIYYEDSDNYWSKREYDSNNNEIYYENSKGKIIDNRPNK